MNRLIILAFSAMCLFSCSEPQQHRKEVGLYELEDERVRAELEKMMEKEGPYTFVIFEEAKSGKFVQFAGNKNEELLFDLPSDQLSEDEFQKASEILGEYKIQHETSATFTDETEVEVNGALSTFSKRINNDIDLAVELTSRVMVEVFGFDEDVDLNVQTD